MTKRSRQAAGSGRRNACVTQSKNTTACDSGALQTSEPTTLASSSNSKVSDAARLAQELGSSGSWSETLLPRSYGTTSQSSTSAANTGSNILELEDTQHNIGRPEDPPPAYSRAPEVHELPAEPARPRSIFVGMVDTPGVPQRSDLVDHGQDPESLLLAHQAEPRRPRGWSSWIQKGKTRRRRQARFLFLVIVFSIVASLLVCLVVGDSDDGDSWFEKPAAPFQPATPTDPTYEQHETTSNIHGSYKLYDKLELTATTGTIDITIEPQPGDHPAVLFLSSDLGSITVRLYEPRRSHARTIFTEIHSVTGSVTAEILLANGGRANVETTTGSQTLSVLTSRIGPHDPISNLTTIARTGVQNVAVSSLDGKPITKLRGDHRSTHTGSLEVTYPSGRGWSGAVHAEAKTWGSVSVTGEGLNYEKQDQRDVKATRGNPPFEVVEVISEGTGSVVFRC